MYAISMVVDAMYTQREREKYNTSILLLQYKYKSKLTTLQVRYIVIKYVGRVFRVIFVSFFVNCFFLEKKLSIPINGQRNSFSVYSIDSIHI